LLATPAFAEPRGHWQFTEDGSGIEHRSCSPGEATLCRAITQFPKSAKSLSPAQRRVVCSIPILGDLQPAIAKGGEFARLDGWVVDIESMTPEGSRPELVQKEVVQLAAAQTLSARRHDLLVAWANTQKALGR
jgi:hypothetical protein